MSKPKGRPPLEPRIVALEQRVTELEEANRVGLEAFFHKMNGEQVKADPDYKPLFERWPGNGSGQ